MQEELLLKASGCLWICELCNVGARVGVGAGFRSYLLTMDRVRVFYDLKILSLYVFISPQKNTLQSLKLCLTL